MRRWLVFCCALSILLGVSSRLWAADADHFNVGQEVPTFALKAVNPEVISGNSLVRLDDYVGGEAKEKKKAVLLTFFATYCEPCKREMPFLALLDATYRARGLQVLSVTIDKETEKIDIARALATQNNVKFPVLSDHYNIVARRYMISKLPCVYLINEENKVAMVNIGYGNDTSKTMLDEIRKALSVPASEPTPEAITTYFATHRGPDQAEVVTVSGIEPPSNDAATRPPASQTSPSGKVADRASDKGRSKGRAKGKGRKWVRHAADD